MHIPNVVAQSSRRMIDHRTGYCVCTENINSVPEVPMPFCPPLSFPFPKRVGDPVFVDRVQSTDKKRTELWIRTLTYYARLRGKLDKSTL